MATREASADRLADERSAINLIVVTDARRMRGTGSTADSYASELTDQAPGRRGRRLSGFVLNAWPFSLAIERRQQDGVVARAGEASLMTATSWRVIATRPRR
jgi:hypothetical protein